MADAEFDGLPERLADASRLAQRRRLASRLQHAAEDAGERLRQDQGNGPRFVLFRQLRDGRLQPVGRFAERFAFGRADGVGAHAHCRKTRGCFDFTSSNSIPCHRPWLRLCSVLSVFA